jgi:hypothetical protein
MANLNHVTGIDEYLRERLMPVEGAIPQIPGIEMFGNSIPAGTIGGDLFEYINFQQRYDIEARIQPSSAPVKGISRTAPTRRSSPQFGRRSCAMAESHPQLQVRDGDRVSVR